MLVRDGWNGPLSDCSLLARAPALAPTSAPVPALAPALPPCSIAGRPAGARGCAHLALIAAPPLAHVATGVGSWPSFRPLTALCCAAGAQGPTVPRAVLAVQGARAPGCRLGQCRVGPCVHSWCCLHVFAANACMHGQGLGLRLHTAALRFSSIRSPRRLGLIPCRYLSPQSCTSCFVCPETSICNSCTCNAWL